MKMQRIQAAARGFSGCWYPSPAPGARCMIVLAGDEGNDLMNRAFARWLTACQGISALCLTLNPKGSPGGVHSWALEQVSSAVVWLQNKGLRKIGILGISMQAVIALSAAARIPQLSCTVALAPADFVPWGFIQEKGKEWPSGTSLLTWGGRELPWQPAFLQKEEYWNLYCSEKKKYKEMHSITVFRRSEEKRPVPEECRIPVEQIRGSLILVGAQDDSMWDSVPCIRRMEQRLQEKNASCSLQVLTYSHGTHLLFPDRLLRGALPIIGGMIPRMFSSGRQSPSACREASRDLDRKLTDLLAHW